MNIADKKVDKIAWTRYQGKLYGVAHNKAGEPLGNVRVENGDKRYRIVAQNFIDDSSSTPRKHLSTIGIINKILSYNSVSLISVFNSNIS